MGLIIIKKKFISTEVFQSKILEIKDSFYAEKETEISLTVMRSHGTTVHLDDVGDYKAISDFLNSVQIYDNDVVICYLGFSTAEKLDRLFNITQPIRFSVKENNYFCLDNFGKYYIYIEGFAFDSMSKEKKELELIRFITKNIYSSANLQKLDKYGIESFVSNAGKFDNLKIVLGTNTKMYIHDEQNFYNENGLLFSGKSIVKFLSNKQKKKEAEINLSPTTYYTSMTEYEKVRLLVYEVRDHIYFVSKNGMTNKKYYLTGKGDGFYYKFSNVDGTSSFDVTAYQLINSYNIFWINKLNDG